MSIRLRGHHLLCLLGFRGMGYSESFARNMRRVYETIRNEPETPITIVSGIDDLCRHFPCDQPNHCRNTSVMKRDETVLRHLGLEAGACLPWREIRERIARTVSPSHLPQWCQGCPWLRYGVCEQGVERIQAGEPLPELPPVR